MNAGFSSGFVHNVTVSGLPLDFTSATKRICFVELETSDVAALDIFI
jgi:hypothetical protein